MTILQSSLFGAIQPDLLYIWLPYWGIFPFRVRFTDLHGFTWSFPLTKCAPRRRFVYYCYDDLSMEPLGSHPIRRTSLSTQMPSCLSNREMYFSLMSMILLWIRMVEIPYPLTHDLMSFGFPDLSPIWCHTGAYFGSRSRFADSHFCLIIPCYEIHGELRILFHFIMDLRWIFSWVISLGSYFSMSLWFLYGVISGSWILTSSFCRSACQICYVSPLSYSWVIRTDWVHLMPYWGIFPSFSYEDDYSLTDLL